MRLYQAVIIFLTFFATQTAFAAAPTLVLKNQYGEQSNNTVLGGLLVAPISIANMASGGAVASGDNNVILINQTTASQTLTLPAPTHAIGGVAKAVVINVGSSAFSMYGQSVAPSTGQNYLYTGSAWVPVL